MLDREGFLGPEENISDGEVDTLNMLLYVKNRFDVSGGAYHEMAQLCREMPRHYKLKDRIAELNKLWDIRPTPEGTCGIQQSLEERLRRCLEHLVRYKCRNFTYVPTRSGLLLSHLSPLIAITT